EVGAPFYRMVSNDLGRRVRPAVDESGPRTGIRSGIKRRQSLDANARNFLRREFRAGEQERIIQPVLRTQARRAIAAELDVALAVRIGRERELVEERRRE